MDRISELPEDIVHHILSCFDTEDTFETPPAELVRMSVLSKNWFKLTASFPELDFSIRQFSKDLRVSRLDFFKYVKYTTSRFCHQNLTAESFSIFTTLQNPAELEIVNSCIELILKNGVRGNLGIHITNSSDVQTYRIPNTLLSVSELKHLSISDCELPSSLMVDGIKFKSLNSLTLKNLHIDDEVIKYIISSCPLLELLQIGRCQGLKRFCVCGHKKLQRIWFNFNTPIERIDIEAPNLTEFTVIDYDEIGQPQMNLDSCKKLTSVNYFGHPSTNLYDDFLSNFPFIENLSLITMYARDNLKLSSDSLRTLVLHSDYDLEDIELRIPKLVFFIYSCMSRMRPLKVMDVCKSLLSNSTHLKACMQCYPDDSIDALWFHKLRLFFDKKNGFKVSNLYIHAIYSENFKELEKLKELELPPYELEHVELQLDAHEDSSAHIAFVDAVLWCFRPLSLTLRLFFPLTDSEEQSDVVKFTYDKLVEQAGADLVVNNGFTGTHRVSRC